MNCATLDQYLKTYGGLLGEQAQHRLEPLHVPGRNKLPALDGFIRKPYPAQHHLVAGAVAALEKQKSVGIIAEVGTGKTIQSIATAHLHAKGANYRTLVFCPGHLVEKWKREILATLDGVSVTIIEHCSQLNRIRKKGSMPRGIEWYVIARDRAKLGAKWKGAWTKVGANSVHPVRGGLRCPRCGSRLENDKGTGYTEQDLDRKQLTCQAQVEDALTGRHKGVCGERLWTYIGKKQGGLDRFEPAKYIHKRMRKFFDYLIIDEAHEEKGVDTAQANAAGSLMAACKKVIALTGTLIGGYAEHIRSLMFRMSPQSLLDEGFGWEDSRAFSKKYGRIERTVFEKEGVRANNRQSRGGGSRRVSEAVKPGIMPTLFGRHLLGNTVYLSLTEVSDNLPPLKEIIVPVLMDTELEQTYQDLERTLVNTNRQLVLTGNRSLLAAMLQCLLAYPDLPFGWDMIHYSLFVDGEKTKVPVVKPPDLPETIRPKEQALIDAILKEKAMKRQCWVFVQYTETHPVLERLRRVLTDAGLKAGVLKSSVPVAKREAWIADNAPGLDVVISHPKLVETGLDLFDNGPGGHNFCTIMFYETGYNTFTLRQASRRGWRIGQKRECRIYYFFYECTAQAAAMALIGKKLSAANAIEGKFSADGLVAMGGDDVSIEMALAKTLDENLKGDAARAWEAIADSGVSLGSEEEWLPPQESSGITDEDRDEIRNMLDADASLMDQMDELDELDDDAEFTDDLDDIADLLKGSDDLLGEDDDAKAA